MFTFDDWLEMQNNGLYDLLQEFKKSPIYATGCCRLLLAQKDLICVYADEAHIKLGYDTVKAMLKEKKLRQYFDVVCKYSGDGLGFIDIDGLVRNGLRPTWNETYTTLLDNQSSVLDLMKKILVIKPNSKIYLGPFGLYVNVLNEEIWTKDLVDDIPELYILYIDAAFGLGVSGSQYDGFDDCVDMTKEIMPYLL